MALWPLPATQEAREGSGEQRFRMIIRLNRGLAAALAMTFALFQAGSAPAPAPGSPGIRLYVTNRDADSVSVLDPGQPSPVRAVVTLSASPHGLAASPDGNRVYVANTGSRTLSLIDPNPV